MSLLLSVMMAVQSAPAPSAPATRPPPEEATDALLAFERLIGRWHPVEETLSDGYRAWLAENEISDSWVEFQWGTDRRWIDFGDWRVIPSGERRQGAGIIAYDHSRHRITFREHGAREVTVTGTLELTDDQTIVRDVAIITPTGGFRQRATWRWDTGNPDCFTWTATRIQGEEASEGAPYRLCRRSE